MKLKKVFILVVAVVLATLLSGCSASAMRSNSWAGLSADAEKAYLANGSFVYAINLNNGNQAWQYPAEKADTKESFFATPVLTEDGQLLITSAGTNHSLISLNAASGSTNWTFSDPEGVWIASPIVVDETIYAPNTDGKLYAFDLLGNFLWAKHIGGTLWSQPVSDGEFLYINSLDHHLYAFNLSTQEVLWKAEATGAIPGSPALDADGNLYLGSFGAKIEAINASAQNTSWSFETKGWVWDAPVIEENTLYVGDLEGNFYAINTIDGRPVWNSIQPDGTIIGSPLITEDFIVIGTESGSAYAIDREGAIIWQYSIGGRLYTSPVQGDDLILFSPMEMENQAALVALDLEGRQVWQFIPEN